MKYIKYAIKEMLSIDLKRITLTQPNTISTLVSGVVAQEK